MPGKLTGPNQQIAYCLTHFALAEVNKRVSRAAMVDNGSDEASGVATDAYRALFDALIQHDGPTTVDSPALSLEAQRTYRRELGEEMQRFLERKGPRALIHLGDVEDIEDA